MRIIRVLIVDPSEMARNGLRSICEQFKGGSTVVIKVVDEVNSATDGITCLDEKDFDVIVTEARLSTCMSTSLLDHVRLMKAPRPQVVVLSVYNNATYVAQAIVRGVSDYLLKSASPEEITGAILGTKDPTQLFRHVENLLEEQAEELDLDQYDGLRGHLTPREVDVMNHIAFGLSNQEIGRSLGISVETVKEHVGGVLDKLECASRTQVAIWAVKNGHANVGA